ncbi:unnamed protein product [Rhizophagus irregularis]|nr:unnamed protein product [Rhizophagus irregularis]
MIEPGVITTIHNLPQSLRQRSRKCVTSTSDTHMSTTDTHPPPFKEGHTWSDKLGSKGWLDAFYARKNHQESVDAFKLYEDRLSARAKLWGTSANSIEYREGMVKDLSAFQDHYHQKITALTDRQLFFT